MKEKKLWVFDYDGVLVFSVRVTFQCIIESAREVGVLMPSFKLLKESWGKNIDDDLFPKLAEKLNWTYVQREYVLENFLIKNQKLSYPLPDSIDDFLRKASLKKDLAILTNRTLESLIASAYKSSIDLKLFKEIVFPINGLHKPNPQMFNSFWQNYKPEELVFIGDSIAFDLMTAKNHKPEIDFIAIVSGLHEKNEFIQSGVSPRYILNSPVEMEKWL